MDDADMTNDAEESLTGARVSDTPVAAKSEDVLPIPTRPPRWSNSLMTLVASFVLPGLGQMLAGRWQRGGILMAVCLLANFGSFAILLTPSGLPFTLAFVPIVLMLFFANATDACFAGWRADRPLLGGPLTRAIAIVVLFMLIAIPISTNTALARYAVRHTVEAFIIRGASMVPTLQSGDQILAYKHQPLKRWDVVVAGMPGKNSPYAYRIVGLPSEQIEIVDTNIQINGQITKAPCTYCSLPYQGWLKPGLLNSPGAGCEGNAIQLGPDEYYLLGDSCMRALDSRLWEEAYPGHQLGATPAGRIIGKARCIYWPLNRIRELK